MIYLFICILLIGLSFHYDLNGQNKGYNFWWRIFFFLFVAVSGFRYKVGGDTLAYMDAFNDIPLVNGLFSYDFTQGKMEPFWVILSSICKTIWNDFLFFQFIHALIVNTIFFKFIKKYSKAKFLSLLLYYIFFFIYFNTEILRESLAICVFLIAYDSFRSKKWFRYYLFALIAFLFHYSAIIIFIFPLFSNSKLNKSSFIKLGFVFIILSSIAAFIPEIINLLSFSSSLSERYETYSNITVNINGMIYILTIFGLIPYLVIRLSQKIIGGDKPLVFDDLFVGYFFLIILYTSVSGFGRFLNYLIPFMLVFYSNFLIILFRNLWFKVRYQIVFLLIVLFSIPKLLYYTRNTSHLVNNTRYYNRWYPYSSIFTKEEFYFREVLYREGMKETSERLEENQ